jgi:hypothetical protein
MGQREVFHYLTSEEFLKLTLEERAAYLERVKEHLAALEAAQRHVRDPDGEW